MHIKNLLLHKNWNMAKAVGKNRKTQQQEAQVEELKANLKKRKSVLKGLRTRLGNYQKKITEFQTRGMAQILHKMESMDQLRQEIAQLALELKSKEAVKTSEREELSVIAKELGGDDFMGREYQQFKQDQEHFEEFGFDFQFDEKDSAKMRDMFQEYQVAPEEEEQKDIRKIFIRLSNRLHPDKAKNEKQAQTYHSIMQQINDAYKSNDVNTLLELEAKYLDQSEIELDESIEVITDILQQKIDKLEQEIFLINGQIERTSGEIHNLRYSELGILLKQLEIAEETGESVEDAVAQMEKSIEEMEQMKALLEESLQMGMVSLKLRHWLNEHLVAKQVGFADIQQMIQEEYGEDSDPDEFMQDFFHMMADGFDELVDDEELTFPIDTPVKVAKKVIRNKVNVKGWQGRVIDGYINHDGREYCEIALDSISLKSIPEHFLEKAAKERADFFLLEVPVDKLAIAEPRDSNDEAFTTYRELYHRYTWKYVTDDPAQQQRLYEILTKKLDLQDDSNWDHYLDENLTFPFKATYLDRNRKPIEVKATDIVDYEESYGHIVAVKNKSKYQYIPLCELSPSKKENDKIKQILQDYKIWHSEYF